MDHDMLTVVADDEDLLNTSDFHSASFASSPNTSLHHLDSSASASSASTATATLPHPHTIIHIDIDCFYAQCEELHNPALRSRPVGIQQKHLLVTCNYAARARGVSKMQPLALAQRICPELVIIRGEDLARYRQMSARIFELFCTFGAPVERLGLDENYIDVTALVAERLRTETTDTGAVSGFVHPADEDFSAEGASCRCGCRRRLAIGSRLASELRSLLHSRLGLTSCAGIAHNKLLAKWVGARHKPNAQTVFIPWMAATVWRQLRSLREICGIGERTERQLHSMLIGSVQALQDAPVEVLVPQFGAEMAAKLKQWSFGADGGAAVRHSAAPKSIGLEDACAAVTVRAEVEEKFRVLLVRLVELVAEDGRVPVVLKITVRKWEAARRTSHRETKQANCGPGLFRRVAAGKEAAAASKLQLVEGAAEQLLRLVMRLFERAVDLRRPFNITLLGLAFSKFQEGRRRGPGMLGGLMQAGAVAGGGGGSGGIANYLLRKSSDVEVQSVTCLRSDGLEEEHSIVEASSSSCSSSSGAAAAMMQQRHSRHLLATAMECGSTDGHSTDASTYASDASDAELEPSPKKSRRLNGGRLSGFAGGAGPMDAASPSKLRVGELRLGSSALAQRSPETETSKLNTKLEEAEESGCCDLGDSSPEAVATAVTASLFYPAVATASTSTSAAAVQLPAECPASVDPQVFNELPADVRAELLAQWRAAASGAAAGKASTTATNPLAGTGSGSGATKAGAKSANTLHRYFVANRQQM